MPNRVIREGLLDSSKYWSVLAEERGLFVHLLLLADDFGLVSLAPVLIRRRCFNQAPGQQKIDAMLAHLAAADLIRPYEIDCARYAFIPKFRQTLRIEKAKHPMPPSELFEDDEHAKEKFLKNSHKFPKVQSRRTTDAKQMLGTRQAEVEVESKESKGSESKPTPSAPEGEPQFSDPLKVNGNGASKGHDRELAEWARAHGISRGPAEADLVYQARVIALRAKARREAA